MKKQLLTIILFAAIFTNLQAQVRNNIRIYGLAVEQAEQSMRVSFKAETGRKTARRGETVTYAPVITNGTYKVSLPVIIVQSKHSDIIWQRHEWTADMIARHENGLYVRNKQTVDYHAEIPAQSWMPDARLEIEMVISGCGSSYRNVFTAPIRKAEEQADIIPEPIPESDILPEPDPAFEPEVITTTEPIAEPETRWIPEPTLPDILAETFSFVTPAEELKPAINFYDDQRDNGLTIYYKINSYTIEPDYSGNRQTLINLLAAINVIRNSGGSDINRIMIAGFSSPEGPFELNDRLAWERAVSVKEYILTHTDIPDEDIVLFNGSADWLGVRLMIENDMDVPAREEVLDIIDNHPVWDSKTQTGRTTLIRNLNDGKTYRYMVDNIFPKLRNGAFIKVYYDNHN